MLVRKQQSVSKERGTAKQRGRSEDTESTERQTPVGNNYFRQGSDSDAK